MYCKNCGKEISDDSNYCHYCGAYLKDVNIDTSKKSEDPRITNRGIFHNSNDIEIDAVRKNITSKTKTNKSVNKKIFDILNLIYLISSSISLALLFFLMAFVSNIYHYTPKNHSFVLGMYIPLIILLIISSLLNIYFLVYIIIKKIRLFRMLIFRIISIVFSISSFVLLIIALTKFPSVETKVLSPVIYASVGITLFAVILTWSVSLLNNKLKLFIK